jgi:hypothetical protein
MADYEKYTATACKDGGDAGLLPDMYEIVKGVNAKVGKRNKYHT